MPLDNPAVSGGIESYIRLVLLFTIFITVLILLLCYLYLAIRRARDQELLSREFSYLMIEGLESERRRISRELHDIVLPRVNEKEISDMIRSICVNLMPPDFTRISLKDALAQLCLQFAKQTGIECACSIQESLDFSNLNAENQLHIFRMVQESFNNIIKHSNARAAALITRYNSSNGLNNILICVSDDGVGLLNKPEGLGMRSIRQRAAILGAKLDFRSEPENGLMVRIELPYA